MEETLSVDGSSPIPCQVRQGSSIGRALAHLKYSVLNDRRYTYE